VGRELIDRDPPAFVAFTVTRSVLPASVCATTYVDAVAPVIDVHVAPDGSQRRHRYEYVIGAVPVHPPVDALNTPPNVAAPETTGQATFTGGAGATAAVEADVATVVPAAFVAPTSSRSAAPTSAGCAV
jgi:hypothetical protein